MDTNWIVEHPEGIYSIDGDIEKYLNSNPHPDYELHQVILVDNPTGVAVFVWKMTPAMPELTLPTYRPLLEEQR